MRAVLDHVGIAVGDLAAALAFYRDALGLEVEASEEVASQAVRAHFVEAGASKLELLEATAAQSPIAKFVSKRGPGLHHITLRVDDIEAAISHLKARGTRMVDDAPRPGAEGALVAFIHPSAAHGVLVELKQASTRPARGDAAPSALAVRRFTIGDLELVTVADGFFRLDGGSMFGVVPKALWTRKAGPDDRNRITLAMRALIIRGARTMIVDAGLGDKEDARFVEMYGVDRRWNLDHALAAARIAPADIDIVLATHLHFDHAGGFVAREPNGRLVPRFPRAQYVARRGEWDDAMRPGERSRASYLVDNYAPLADAGVLQLVDADATIMPGVRVRRTGGHTAHHQIVLIESGGKSAAFAADLMPTAAHVGDLWVSAFDTHPLDTVAAKKEFADEATAKERLVFFSHDPAIPAGYVRQERGKRAIEPA
jgi:methylmalonyl-CoA epimerase